MATHQEKKSEELAHLEKALQLLGFKDYVVSDKNSESPDFLIEINNQKIGVEVTRVYRNPGSSNSAKTQSDLPFIVEKAIQVYNGKGGIPLVFCFSFDGRAAVNNRTEVSQQLGDLLYEYTTKYFSAGMCTPPQKINIEFPTLVSSVFAKPTDGTTSKGVAVSGFDSVLADSSVIEDAIREKEALLPKYRERCDVIWLLIVLPSMQLAADFMLLQGNEDINLPHNFDAVYVLDEYRNVVQNVKKAQHTSQLI